MATVKDFTLKQPCNNCPYRKDAPLQHWAVEEFIDLLESEKDLMGKVYGCHKKNGHVCVGWLMDQDERRLPSIELRILISKNNVTREYLDDLRFDIPRYASICDMVQANYPELTK